MITKLSLTNFRRHATTDLSFDADDQLIVVSGANGAGKCLPGHVIVHDGHTGEPVRIDQFVAQQRSATLGYTGGHLEPVRVTGWHSLGPKPTLKVRFEDGGELHGAKTHPVLGTQGCVRIQDLRPGDRVARTARIPTPREPERTGTQDSGEIWWVRVETVEEAGTHDCFDITVDTAEHLYVAGKTVVHNSSLLEGITFALYGEGRNGRTHLDRLVRRGSELEGLKAEIGFSVADDTYRVVRSREGRNVGAVLYGNDNPLVDGTRAVNAAVEQILGMDVTGFRVAVIAQQRELDALARMGAPARQRTIGRLLRLDALSRARDDARASWNTARNALSAMPSGADISESNAALSRARAAAERASAAENDCRAVISELEARLAITAGVDEAYHAARRQVAAAEARVAEIRGELDRAGAELAAVSVPDEDPGYDTGVLARLGLAGANPDEIGAGELARISGEIERNISKGETAHQAEEQRRMLTVELADVQTKMERCQTHIAGTATMAGLGAQIAQAGQTAEEARRQAIAASERRDDLRARHSQAQAHANLARERLAALATLGAVCDRCGQPVDDRTRTDQSARTSEEVAEAERRAENLAEAGRDATQQMLDAEAAAVRADDDRRDAEERRRALGVVLSELDELTRRANSYRDRLGRLKVEPVDLDEAYARKGDLALVMGMVRVAEETRRERVRAKGRRADLQAGISQMAGRLAQAETELAAAQVDSDLEAAWEERARIAEAHRDELCLLSELSGATGAAETEVVRAAEALRSATLLAQSRRDVQHRGNVASAAGRLLDDVTSRLGGQTRPSLEASISNTLGLLSDGRFSDVQLDSDYEVYVSDDGSMRALEEFSGGEQDLIALGVRLGIGQVVSERAGGGVGFLILDEVFGSQDDQRRDTIIAGLRSLRDAYGQVWAISHVGGIADVADRVLEVHLDDETGETYVT